MERRLETRTHDFVVRERTQALENKLAERKAPWLGDEVVRKRRDGASNLRERKKGGAFDRMVRERVEEVESKLEGRRTKRTNDQMVRQRAEEFGRKLRRGKAGVCGCLETQWRNLSRHQRKGRKWDLRLVQRGRVGRLSPFLQEWPTSQLTAWAPQGLDP